MTREEFRKYIRENIVILDGATGTNLMAAGMPVGVCPEEWVMEHPQVILDLQKAYVDNGTNIVYTPPKAPRTSDPRVEKAVCLSSSYLQLQVPYPRQPALTGQQAWCLSR